ncbi:hypothetical protein [Rubinisphaera sp. JC750]|uniref:hypothetical protein n=1 Tax=Rubinisphaera sp. JC750 TaxID=2898658 RepID=UPI001F33D19C|nr:hypothetical protein [Rubinisphaera sp. JC750]
MAACDEGYPCQTCGQPVKNIVDSALYVHFVLGEVQVHELFNHPETHLLCEPELSQFIVHEKFEAPVIEGPADKRLLPEAEREARENRITAAWERLRNVRQLGIPLTEYPLPPESA